MRAEAATKSTGCFSRFDFQQLQGSSQQSATPVPRDPVPFPGLSAMLWVIGTVYGDGEGQQNDSSAHYR